MAGAGVRGDLTRGPVGRHLLSMTLPMIVGIVAIVSQNLVDTYFIGQLGVTELSAVSFTFPVIMTLSSLTIGLGAGAVSVVSRAYGRGDQEQVRRRGTDAIILGLLIVGVVAAAGWLTVDPLFRLIGADDQVLPDIRDYMRIWYVGLPMLTLPMVGNNLLRALGDARVPSAIMVGSAILNVVLTPLLIFGVGPFPRLEVAGAALGTVISNAAAMAMSVAVLHWRERIICWELPKAREFFLSSRGILHVGAPAAASNMINPIGLAALTAIAARFGNEVVAGVGVATRLEQLAVIPLLALSAGIGPVVGQNWGADAKTRVREALTWSGKYCLLWGTAIGALVLAASGWVTPWFSEDPRVQAFADLYLRLVPLTFCGYGITIVVSAAMNAAGKPLRATLLAFTRMLVIFVPLAWALADATGTWSIPLAGIAANVLGGTLAWWVGRRALA